MQELLFEEITYDEGLSDFNNSKLIIELDKDTFDLEKSEEASLYPYDPSNEDLDIRELPQTIFEWIRKYKQGKLIIDPEFQRNLVWDIEQKSRFIESIIINFPLPPIYANEKKDGDLIIIDGLQRTTTLRDYLDNKFPLKGLQALTKLNGKFFEDLDDLKSKIEDKKFTVYILKPSIPPKVIYDLFNRINTGGTILNRQEVRNCLFQGKSTNLLKTLSEEPYFKEAINHGISPKRMKDREAILRYISFRILDYKKDYKGDMSDFIEKAMMMINVMGDSDIEMIKKDFKKVMKLTYSFFGENNFRYFFNEKKGLVNIALLESVAYFFSICEEKYIIEHKNKILENYYNELLKDPQFEDSIRLTTNNKSKVKMRFDKVQEILSL